MVSKSLCGPFSECNERGIKIHVDKMELLNCSMREEPSTTLNHADWKQYFTRKIIAVKNNFLTQHHVCFMTETNDGNLLNYIKGINPETLAVCILHDDVSLLLQNLNKKVYCSMYGSADAKEWNKLNFGDIVPNKKQLRYQVNEEVLENTFLGKMIQDIDTMLNNGYAFHHIQKDRWLHGYRRECLDIISSPYPISTSQKEKLVFVLTTLKNDLYHVEETKHSMDADVSIEVLQNLLKMDGFEDDFTL